MSYVKRYHDINVPFSLIVSDISSSASSTNLAPAPGTLLGAGRVRLLSFSRLLLTFFTMVLWSLVVLFRLPVPVSLRHVAYTGLSK